MNLHPIDRLARWWLESRAKGLQKQLTWILSTRDPFQERVSRGLESLRGHFGSFKSHVPYRVCKQWDTSALMGNKFPDDAAGGVTATIVNPKPPDSGQAKAS